MTLYLTRHGETEWNVQNKVCGITDVELTDKGRSQAKELGEKLRDHKIDLIVSSPLKRALETARIAEGAGAYPLRPTPGSSSRTTAYTRALTGATRGSSIISAALPTATQAGSP